MDTKPYLRLLTKSPLLMKGIFSQTNIANSKNKPFIIVDKEFNQIQTIEEGIYVEKVNVYEINKNGQLKDWFSEINHDLKTICLPEKQIPAFCKKYYDWLSKNQFGSTFFLLNGIVNGVTSIHVAQVVKKQNSCSVYHGLLEGGENPIFESENQHRIVVPV